jgi:hypothetical protein
VSEDAKNSLTAWISAILFFASAALTVKLFGDRLAAWWSPVDSGVISLAMLYFTIQHFARSRRAKNGKANH